MSRSLLLGSIVFRISSPSQRRRQSSWRPTGKMSLLPAHASDARCVGGGGGGMVVLGEEEEEEEK